MFFAWCVRVAGFLHRANIRRRASKTLQGCFPQAEGIIIEMALAGLLELVDENTTPCSRSFEKARSVYVQYQFRECVPGNKFVNVAPSSALVTAVLQDTAMAATLGCSVRMWQHGEISGGRMAALLRRSFWDGCVGKVRGREKEPGAGRIMAEGAVHIYRQKKRFHSNSESQKWSRNAAPFWAALYWGCIRGTE